MPKHIPLAFAASLPLILAAALIASPAIAQDAEKGTETDAPPAEISQIEISQIDISEIDVTQIAPPRAVAEKNKTSWEIGGSYTDSISLTDKGSVLTLGDVTTLDLGLRNEREIARHNNISLSGALSAQARFGTGNSSELNGIAQTGDTNFRQLGAYADVIARLEGNTETAWTPFVSAGIGIAEDRAVIDNQTFKDLSPVGRYRAGLEKKVSDRVTLGVSAGQSFKLD